MAFSLRLLAAGTLAALSLVLAGEATAAGGSYVFEGGTPAQQAQVRAALEASEFDWGLVPATITIHVARGVDAHARRGHIWLDANLLDAGRFSWAVVQDEYAHQVDFFLLDDAKRAHLNRLLGGSDWCYGAGGLGHSDYGCERFASTLVWAYWQSPDNAYRPRSARDESAALPPAEFRRVLAELVGMPEASARVLGATPARTQPARKATAATARRTAARR